MQNFKSFVKSLKRKIARLFSGSLIIMVIFSLVLNANLPLAQAANNLIKEGSFETNINSYWGIWKDTASTRTYQLFRAYDAPFGYGSYSAAIEAKGAPEQKFSAVLATNNSTNKFTVDSTKYYYLIFYAKATKDMELLAYLENADTYAAITPYRGGKVTGQWQKFIINIQPTASVPSLLAFVYGDMPDGTVLYLDGIQLFEANTAVNTTEVKGYIGDANKQVNVTNIGSFSLDDVTVELPFYDNTTGKAATKRYTPKKIDSNSIYIDMYDQTFAGIGKVYVKDAMIGRFNYNVQPKITEIIPSMVRVDEDVTVYGSGFMPTDNNTFAVINLIDENGKTAQKWIAPSAIDSKLTQLTIKLPKGVINGNLYVQTSFTDIAGKDVVSKSGNTAYKVKPVIYGIEWSQRGYEMVGDKLVIHGKGISNGPSVNFYDNKGVKFETKAAKLVTSTTDEAVEVETTKKYSEFSVTVTSGGVESDMSTALYQSAKPKITALTTKYSRTMFESNEKLPAAKTGEVITITGIGLTPVSTDAVVQFQGVGKTIDVTVPATDITGGGASLKVTVPAGAQNGYIGVKLNGQASNYLPLEIVPTISTITPDPAIPGQNITISATGVGPNIFLAKVYFKVTDTQEIVAYPTAITYSGDTAVVQVKAPLSSSNKYTAINIQYDKWRDTGTAVLNVRPAIISASLNMDTKILSIKGYGFSIKPSENKLTYKLADQDKTPVTPNARIIGVYATEEGQEIRVQLSDSYYYGYVTVTVGEYSSNEVNFGPASVSKIARRVEYVKTAGSVMGVLYISGYNFGPTGGVKVGSNWANVHYRSDNFIIAVVDQQYVYDNPVIIAK